MGICPYCRQTLIPKCGAIKTWHWAHPQSDICDPWREGETEWHLNWKRNFPKDYTEVIISKKQAKHIADYFNPVSNVTVEFQNSPLSFYERLERESFYNNLQWIVHVEKDTLHDTGSSLKFQNFWWKHPKQWVTELPPVFCNIYLDSDHWPSDRMLKIIRIKKWKTRTYIDGTFVMKELFISKLNSDV